MQSMILLISELNNLITTLFSVHLKQYVDWLGFFKFIYFVRLSHYFSI